ncbi:MAG: DUF4105 domain-containing protein [Spirochaetaceae bacterium]|nr:DUF4105 domain-containing protein [Spirochaetaceae bacterium]
MKFFAKSLGLLILGTFFFLFPRNALAAQDRNRGDYLTFKVAVMGPGDELYFWWGHVALIVEDAVSGTSRFYDYGVFSFREDNFFFNFAFGRLLYYCVAPPTEAALQSYLRTNRDITLYTLDLSAENKEAVWRFAERNVLPENRYYYYHHFKDNCSTRIRDLLDLALEGQFKARFADAPGRFTLRQHVRRHTWFSPFFDWFLNFLMGQDIDRPLTIWEELFLPSEVGRRIADFRYTDAAGTERPLVSSVEVLNRAVGRHPVLETPRRQWIRELVLSLVIALVLALISRLRKAKPEPGRLLWGLAQSALGLFFGIAGLLLAFLTFFTNHDYTYHNSNILYINPLLLAAVPLGIILAAGRNPKRRLLAERLLRGLWTYVFLGGILSLLIRALPVFYQQNQVTLALVLPFALVLSFIPGAIRRGAASKR